jgi:LysM repeat protein
VNSFFQRPENPLIFYGSGLVILVVLIGFFLFSGEDGNGNGTSLFEEKVAILEERIRNLEKTNDLLAGLEQQLKQSAKIEDRVARLENQVASRMDQLAKEVSILQKAPVRLSAPTDASADKVAVAKTPASYHRVEPGETLYRISRTYGIAIEELRRLNNLTPASNIHPGQKLLVRAEKAR